MPADHWNSLRRGRLLTVTSSTVSILKPRMIDGIMAAASAFPQHRAAEEARDGATLPAAASSSATPSSVPRRS